MSEPDQPDEGYTTEVTAEIRATAEHPDPADLTPEERRHLDLPEPDSEEQK